MRSLQQTTVDDAGNDKDNDRELLNTQLKTTREALPPRQEPHVVAAPVFTPHEANAITPFAHPNTFNAVMAMHSIANSLVTPLQPTATPFQFQLPNLPEAEPARPTRKLFRSKAYCITCGWMKREHTVAEGKGRKPKFCTREFCGNCFKMKAYHAEKKVPFGKDCTFATNRYCFTNVNDWWEYKVRNDLFPHDKYDRWMSSLLLPFTQS